MSIGVAVYLEHLYHVDDRSFTFDADFYLIQRWDDARNYSALFADSGFLDTQACESGGGGGTQEESSIALGTTDGGLVWQPDVGLANVVAGASAYIRHAKQIRLYRIASSSSSGTTTTATTSGGGDTSDISYSYRFETVEFVFARLQMEPDTYHAFPFDSHALPIVVESHSQGVDRINITASTELTGLATDKTGTWPGWLYRMHDASVSRPQPGFTALSAAGGTTESASCRAPGYKARYTFTVTAKRHIGKYWKGALVPTMFLVVSSWAGFFIKHSALMPRIATAFISFLTLSNWGASTLNSLPAVTYTVWYAVFFECARYFVFLALLETVCAHFICEVYSTRSALALDRVCRKLVPAAYVLYMTYLLAIGGYIDSMGANEDDVKKIAALVSIAAFILYTLIPTLVVVAMIITGLKYRQIRYELATNPLAVHRRQRIALDANELAIRTVLRLTFNQSSIFRNQRYN